MYCFQNPFSRAARSVVTNPLSSKCSSEPKRRSSEATSEGSGSGSSIRYIDQLSGASSTDTLPGIRNDYLDNELLSPGPECLASPTIVFTSEDNSKTTVTTACAPAEALNAGTPSTPPTLEEHVGNGCATKSRRRRKLLLWLRSDELSNSSSSASPSPASDSSCKQQQQQQQQQLQNKPSPKHRLQSRRHYSTGSRSMLLRGIETGFSDEEDDDELDDEEEEEEDMDEDEEDTCALEETETEEASSLPSSPAAPATVGLASGGPLPSVPYYGFLSVSGGAMRQESTSTSSPQLTSACAAEGGRTPPTESLVSLKEEKRAGSTETVAIKSLQHLKPGEPSGLEATLGLPVARSCPNLERQSAGCSSASGSSSPSPSPGPAGPRFKPIEEGDIQVCYLNHTRTLVSKILSSRFLRRWETHHLYLNDACLSSKTLTGFLQQPVPYSSMTEVYAVARWDPTYKYCLRIVLPDGSLLLQASNAYTRDQWYHSILWKKSIYKYQHLVSEATKEEVVLRELKALVDFALWTPLQDERVAGAPLESVAKLLDEPSHLERGDDATAATNAINNGITSNGPLIISKLIDDSSPDEELSISNSINSTSNSDVMQEDSEGRSWAEAVLNVAAPLLERAALPPSLARALARLAQRHPRSPLVMALSPAITRCLKHTVDFGKSPDMRRLLQVFIAALYENVDGELAIRDYVASVHGPGSDCPHPRILPNLVSICVAAIFHRFEVSSCKQQQQAEEAAPTSLPPLRCYLLVLNIASEYADWRPGLGALLQPVPFPEDALADKEVQETVLSCVMRRLAKDPRCSVHRVLLPVREPRPGWIHMAAPSSPACPDEGQLFGDMLTTLLACCCRRKRFISSLLKQTGGACILLGVRGCDAAQEALCLMLEWRLLPNEEARLQVVSALQSTESGKTRYSALCQRQRNLQELKGGPRKLTLPVRATDADVALLLGGGALGNLECLSLAFTSVTSACAEQLIKLPALRYLNLWATQFGDTGLQMISEHLQKLQVLNLCETPVSDKGISTLASLTNLRKLNLNSTKLSASTFETLKKRLPSLQEFDVRYTEAW
ncbi:C-Maf-inducing protein isoform X2 [Nasonia vitripennis]|uniref:C-Maf-inducing protein PH domain-containing protein n=1 Tax=Nasonia vitripennis TaxID=7425 RepID=A0A7M7QEU8_NASVI|nr:C-Maf-inducing protein isoform X2 [Nasonia vitripennis]